MHLKDVFAQKDMRFLQNNHKGRQYFGDRSIGELMPCFCEKQLKIALLSKFSS